MIERYLKSSFQFNTKYIKQLHDCKDNKIPFTNDNKRL